MSHLEAAALSGAGDAVVPRLGLNGLPQVLLHGAQAHLARALVKIGGGGVPGGQVGGGKGGVGDHILRVTGPVTAVKLTVETHLGEGFNV